MNFMSFNVRFEKYSKMNLQKNSSNQALWSNSPMIPLTGTNQIIVLRYQKWSAKTLEKA
jgi:hypothetical protein